MGVLSVALGNSELPNNVMPNKGVQCQVIFNKDPLWSKETIKIDIIDFNSKKVIQSVNLHAETLKTASVKTLTQTYNCNKYPQIQFQASYTPSIWSTDVGKTYSSKNIYDLTDQLLAAKTQGTKTLEITLTFPEDFIGVPLLVN